MDKKITKFSSYALDLLKKYDFPGNIRELENAIQRGIVLTASRYIELEHLPFAVSNGRHTPPALDLDSPESLTLKDAQKQLERSMISQALLKTDGNKSKAARTLKISYPSLLTKIN